MRGLTSRRQDGTAQALVEFVLVFPLFLLVLFSIIVFGLYIFYNQQVANAAREASRYAAVHSTTAQCPTVSRVDPILSLQAAGYFRCDAPEKGWTRMVGQARSNIWGMPPAQVGVSACWSGFVNPSGDIDAEPVSPNTFRDCTIGGKNPKTELDS